MDGLLSSFKFSSFQFILRAEDWIHLPAYKGSTLRGAFGHAFKKIVCVNREKVCKACLLKEKCVYSYVFETPPPSDTSKMRKYPYAPHPFVITPPLEEKRVYRQNETLCFELTLIGKSIDFLPYFIYTFDELGRMGIGKGKGRYHLEEVKGERSKVKGEIEGDIEGETRKVKGERLEDEEVAVIYSGKDKTLRNNFSILRGGDLSPSTHHLTPSSDTLHLVFQTPTRLKFNGNLTPNPEFHILIRNLLRRISLLSYFHCGADLDVDFKRLIEEAKEVKVQQKRIRWLDWERYSNRQETKMKMGGFVGSISFEGEIEPFVPFLLLGEHIHVGKGTSFGLGKYAILTERI